MTIKGIDRDKVGNKVSGDMLSKCYHSIEDPMVKTIFNDGNFMDPYLSEEYLKIAEIDYTKYKNQDPPDMELSPETELLFYKLEKSKDEYMAKMKERTEKSKNTLSIFGYDLSNLPVGFNIIFAIVVLCLMIGGIVLMLRTVKKEEKISKKKKKREREEKEE